MERCPSTAWTHPTEPEPGGEGVRTSSQVTRQQPRSTGINATMLLSQLLQQRSPKKRRRRDSVRVFSSLDTPACRAPHCWRSEFHLQAPRSARVSQTPSHKTQRKNGSKSNSVVLKSPDGTKESCRQEAATEAEEQSRYEFRSKHSSVCRSDLTFTRPSKPKVHRLTS